MFFPFQDHPNKPEAMIRPSASTMQVGAYAPPVSLGETYITASHSLSQACETRVSQQNLEATLSLTNTSKGIEKVLSLGLGRPLHQSKRFSVRGALPPEKRERQTPPRAGHMNPHQLNKGE